MDTAIAGYVEDTFTVELVVEICKAYGLFESFNLQDFESPLIDILLNADNEDPGVTQDKFIAHINAQLNFLLKEHMVELNDSATICQKNELLSALFLLQNLLDYSSIITILEAGGDSVMQFAIIMSDICLLEIEDILTIVEHVNVEFLEKLKVFIYKKEESVGVDLTNYRSINKRIVDNLRTFKDFTAPKDSLGITMLNIGVLPGQLFKAYLPFVTGSFTNKTVNEVAIDVLSLLYLSEDGSNTPYVTFRKNSESMFDNIDLITKVDIQLGELIGEYHGYINALKQKVNNEQN